MDSAHKAAIRVVWDYILEVSEYMDANPGYYQAVKWAAQCIRDLLLDNPNTPPLILIDQFQEKMDAYAQVDYIFKPSYDAAEDIKTILIGE